MEKIYYCDITEYESGWGQKPDGYYLCLDKDKLSQYIENSGNSGSYELYWRCGEI